jgi:hypothetical protein
MGADRFGAGATRPKAAARGESREIDRLVKRRPSRPISTKMRAGIEQRSGIRVQRRLEHIGGRTDLHGLAEIHDHDSVTDVTDHVEIM